MEYLASLPLFIKYFVTSLLLFMAMVAIYVRITPHAEFALIRQGNTAAAIAMSGAMIGLALPLASTVLHSVSFVDMVVWSVVAMIAQALVYFLCGRLIPDLSAGIQKGTIAHGLLLGSVSLSVGLINAACVS